MNMAFSGGSEFAMEVGQNAVDVCHNNFGLFEDVMIDALVDIPYLCAALIKYRHERIIYMTCAVGFGANEIAHDGKLRRDLSNVVVHKLRNSAHSGSLSKIQ